jgi:hypothetical protein
MKSLRLVGLMLLISCLATPAVAAKLGVFFDTNATVDNMVFQPATPFDIHVIMYDMNDSALGVEFKVDLPPELVVLQQNWAEGTLVFPYSNQTGGATVGVQVGLGDCIFMTNGWNPTYEVLTMRVYCPTTMPTSTISLSGFPGDTGDTMPRYAQCPSIAPPLLQMTPTDGTVRISVPAETSTWGAVKAQFGD